MNNVKMAGKSLVYVWWVEEGKGKGEWNEDRIVGEDKWGNDVKYVIYGIVGNMKVGDWMLTIGFVVVEGWREMEMERWV